MKLQIVLIKIIFFFLGLISYAQEIPKDTIYLEFIKNKGSQPEFRGVKFVNQNGINFNLYKNNGLINPTKYKPDTLCNKHIKDYRITKINNVDSLIRVWYKTNKLFLIKKYGKLHPRSTNKNNKFITYILEKKKTYFVRYRVFWKNQGI